MNARRTALALVTAGLGGLLGAPASARAQEGLAFVEFVAEDQPKGVEGVDRVAGVAISDDGLYVYALSMGLVPVTPPSKIAVFARDPSTGALSFVDVVRDGEGGITGLGGIAGLGRMTLSPDGKNLYVAGLGQDALLVLSRDAGTGRLTFVEVLKDGVGGVDGLEEVFQVAVSPDGAHAYATGSAEDAVAIFSRDGGTGALTFLGTVRDGVGGVDGLDRAGGIVVSPDGAHVYVAGNAEDALAVFTRDAGTGLLTFLEVHKDGVAGDDGLDSSALLTIPADGNHVYVVNRIDASGNIAVFSRNPATGSLTFVEVNNATAVDELVVSADGERAYTVDAASQDVTTWSRDLGTGALTLLGSEHVPLNPRRVVVSPDRRHAYVTTGSAGYQLRLYQRIAVRCSTTPLGGCHTPKASRGRLVLRDDGNDNRDAASWTWVAEPEVPLAALGTPATTTDYAFCVYDASAAPQPVFEARAPAAGGCKGKACWKVSPKTGAATYKDRLRTPDGLRSVALRTKRIRVSGKGIDLSVPALPLTLPARAQLQNSEGECWEDVFSTATWNTATRFSAKGD